MLPRLCSSMLDGGMPLTAFSCCAMATCIFGVDICGVCCREMRKQDQTRQKTPIKSLCCCPVLSIVVRLSTRTSLLCAQTAPKSAGNVPTGLYNQIKLYNVLVTTGLHIESEFVSDEAFLPALRPPRPCQRGAPGGAQLHASRQNVQQAGRHICCAL